jgi:hypothetical protein
MNIVAKVFRDKISTDTYCPWWTQRWGTRAVYSHRIKSHRVFRKDYALAGIILRYSTEYSSLNLNGRENQLLYPLISPDLRSCCDFSHGLVKEIRYRRKCSVTERREGIHRDGYH